MWLSCDRRKDVYTGKEVCKEGLMIEQASVLYNIGMSPLEYLFRVSDRSILCQQEHFIPWWEEEIADKRNRWSSFFSLSPTQPSSLTFFVSRWHNINFIIQGMKEALTHFQCSAGVFAYLSVGHG